MLIEITKVDILGLILSYLIYYLSTFGLQGIKTTDGATTFCLFGVLREITDRLWGEIKRERCKIK